MNVEPLERGRFLVESESGQPPYLVDLLEYLRNGFCACVDFGARIQPLWEASEKPARPNCKHIRTALKFIGKLVQSLVSFRLKKAERECAVKKILFRLAAFEAKCQLNPTQYGVSA